MSSYAIYQSKLYKIDATNNSLEIISESIESLKHGFKELRFNQGFISKVLYIKEVSIDDVDLIYDLEYKAIYKGKEFVPWKVGKYILETNQIPLGTSEENEARIYGFEKMEQFVFKKEVPIDEVEALIEMKKPILKFQHMGEEVTRIEQKDIRKYLENLIE